MPEFDFTYEEDGSLSLEAAVFQALGAASTCWERLSGTGVFDSDRAKTIGEALVGFIRDHEKPLLGLATTRQLLAELTSRIDTDYLMGGGGLDYSTVGGRPEGIALDPT